jgi:hypothetical protein
MSEVKKLKRARGSLLRAIRSGRMEAPPGYMTFADYQRENKERNEKRDAKQHTNGGTPNVQIH